MRFTSRIRTVDPGWFRDHVLPAHNNSWDRCETALLSDPLERRRIDELAAELKSGFDRPITVIRDHWFSRQPRVVDGMHRAIAAMRSGLDIPIRHGYPAGAAYDHSDVYTVTAAGTELADLLDAAMSSSSFRSASGPWIQCDVGSAFDGLVRLHLPRHTDLRGQIADQLRQRLQDAGIDAVVEFAGIDE